MKKLTAIALFAIANFALAGSSFAQTHAVKANIPFDFTMGGQLLPAGAYVIKSSGSNFINLQNLDKPIRVLGVTMHDNIVARGDGTLVFSKYGDQHFLRKVLSDDAGLDLRTLFQSRRRRRVTRRPRYPPPAKSTWLRGEEHSFPTGTRSQKAPGLCSSPKRYAVSAHYNSYGQHGRYHRLCS